MSTPQVTREEALEKLEQIERLEERLNEQGRLLSSALDRVDELEGENEELRGELAQLRSRVEPDPTNKDYAEKTRSEKVFEVRVAVARRAAQQNGKAKYTYRDVLAQFGNRPSDGHCYTLMEIAGEADGYEFGERNGEKSLRVDFDAVNDDAVVHAVNNGESENGGED